MMFTSTMAVVALCVGQPTGAPLEEPSALPPGAVARIGSPSFRYPSSTEFLGTSADGKRVYTAENFRQTAPNLFVWDAASGRLIAKRPLCGIEEELNHVGFGADGVRTITTVYDSERQVLLKVIDPDTGRVIRIGKPWPPPADGIIRPRGADFARDACTFGPDGSCLYRAGGPYLLYDAATGEDAVLSLSDARPRDIQFSDDGRTLNVYSEANSTFVYSLPSGRLLAEVTEPDDELDSAAKDRGERRIAIAGARPDHKSLAVWMRRKTGWALELHEVGTQRRRLLRDRQTIPGRVRFAPDGKTFALHVGLDTTSGSIRADLSAAWELREVASGRLIASIPGGPWAKTGFAADGKTFYTLREGVLVPWDVATGEPTRGAPSPLGPVRQYRFAPDGKLVGLAGGFVYTWDAVSGRELSRTRVPKGMNAQAAAVFSPRADRLNYFTVDDELVSWEIVTGTRTRTRLPDVGSTRAMWHQLSSLDGRYIEKTDRRVTVWEPAIGKKLGDTILFEAESWHEGVRALAASGDGRQIAVARELEGRPIGWRRRRVTARESRSLVTVQPLGWVNGPSELLDRNFAPLFGREPKTNAINFETRNAVAALAFSPNGRFLAAVGYRSGGTIVGGELTVLDTATGRLIGPFGLGLDAPGALDFSPDGRMLSVTDGVGQVRVIETATWGGRAVLRECGGPGAWSPDGRTLATTLPDGRLLIWDTGRLGAQAKLGPEALERAWADLAADSRLGFAAILALGDNPDQAIPLLARKLPPITEASAGRIKTLIASLGSEKFAEREAATSALEALGPVAEPAMRDAVKAAESAEEASRLIDILRKVSYPVPTAEELRAIRAVEVVERIATADAIRLLEVWASGVPGVRLTEEAKAALGRLKQK